MSDCDVVAKPTRKRSSICKRCVLIDNMPLLGDAKKRAELRHAVRGLIAQHQFEGRVTFPARFGHKKRDGVRHCYAEFGSEVTADEFIAYIDKFEVSESRQLRARHIDEVDNGLYEEPFWKSIYGVHASLLPQYLLVPALASQTAMLFTVTLMPSIDANKHRDEFVARLLQLVVAAQFLALLCFTLLVYSDAGRKYGAAVGDTMFRVLAGVHTMLCIVLQTHTAKYGQRSTHQHWSPSSLRFTFGVIFAVVILFDLHLAYQARYSNQFTCALQRHADLAKNYFLLRNNRKQRQQKRKANMKN